MFGWVRFRVLALALSRLSISEANLDSLVMTRYYAGRSRLTVRQYCGFRLVPTCSFTPVT
ncbi:MAG: hypothetical protein ACI9ON_002381 [Limisphaerales bacterium]|jgi:hypothetical protein